MRLAIALILVAACDADPAPYDHAVSCEATLTPTVSSPPRQLDVLLAISDAPAMGAYHDRLRVNLPVFANVLETQEGGLPSVHVAVVGSPLVLIDEGRPWFTCDDGWCRERNYDGPFDDALAAFGDVPASRHGATDLLARTLGAAELDGFLRPDAILMVLVISADDDTSPGDPRAYVDALRARLADPAALFVGIVGPDVAPRLDEMLDALPNRSARISIDRGDWSDVVPYWGDFDPRIGNGCLRAPVDDLEPDLPGLQPGCYAEDEDGVIPPCVMAEPTRPAADTPLPCWRVEPAPPEWQCALQAIVERATPPARATQLRCPCTP